ncbi:MAG: cytochrome d ubiquinol oxidase subunit II [Kyrpidia tusciae]|nr:cytochrome d ubiquinol oxidase subunit II [Kyrpidia tusciae]MBE3552796.1 cytochrome d ubiquinol oxidase subunit II [Kyrpidia tusciae]
MPWLNELWFILIAVLFIGFFFLEGFDFGVGIVTPFLGKTDRERRVLINTIGPFWDANEVWLITAAGAMFAAFPHWYATLFSGFYAGLALMLLALIVRGVAFEFRSKVEDPRWRKTWDWAIFAGSGLPPFLWGIALADLIQGVPIDGHMEFVGGIRDLLNPYALVGGAAVFIMCVLHGLVFITLRTEGELRDRARRVALQAGALATVVLLFFVAMTYLKTDIFLRRGIDPGAIPVMAGLALVSVRFFIEAKRDGWAFVMTGLVIILSVATVFIGLFPRVMISSIHPAYDLTIYNAASNPYSLYVMSLVALALLPFVLAYQGWSYYIFRKRVHEEEHLDY